MNDLSRIPVRHLPILSLDEAAEEGWEDDILPLDHPTMREAIARYNEVVALKRLTDLELAGHSRQQRKYERQERRGGGR